MGTLGRNGHRYRELRKRILAGSNICIICGEAIDMSLSGRHPKGPTLEHRIPLSLGGTHSLDNLGPAHFGCNSGKRDRVKSPQSRNW